MHKSSTTAYLPQQYPWTYHHCSGIRKLGLCRGSLQPSPFLDRAIYVLFLHSLSAGLHRITTKDGVRHCNAMVLNGSLPCKMVCIINNTLFELLQRGLEMGTRTHVLLSAYNQSANARVWAAVWIAYVMRTCSITINALGLPVT